MKEYYVPELRMRLTEKELSIIKRNYYLWPFRFLLSLAIVSIYYLFVGVFYILQIPAGIVCLLLEAFQYESCWNAQRSFLDPQTILRRRLIVKTAKKELSNG